LTPQREDKRREILWLMTSTFRNFTPTTVSYQEKDHTHVLKHHTTRSLQKISITDLQEGEL
jgi:hypothetical protein